MVFTMELKLVTVRMVLLFIWIIGAMVKKLKFTILIHVMLELGSFIHETHYDERNNELSHWCNNQLHGIDIWYYHNGSINRLKHWRNDKKHGIEIIYYPNGSISWLRHWHHGVRHGITIAYYPSGSISWLQHWRNNKKLK